MQAPVRVTMELQPGEVIAGWLARDGEDPTRFEGLLELVATLVRMRADPLPDGDAGEG